MTRQPRTCFIGTTRVASIAALAGAVLTAAVLVDARPSAQQRPLPEFEPFVAQIKAKLQTDADAQTGYAFTERQVEQKVDGKGRVTQEKVKVFEVYPGLPGKEPYRRLIEENGKPVAPAALAKKDRERQKEAESYVRTVTTRTEADRQKAQREYEKARRERTEDIDDIFNVFDVKMLGRDVIEAHDTISFSLTPRPNVKPKTDSSKMMHHFTAKAWISESDHELVRVQVEAVDNVSFGLGLLARLHKGAVATYQRRKVNGEAWLPAKVTYGGSGRVLLVRKLRLGGYSEFSNYRKFTVDTTTTIPSAP
jgi:hypothetical protein